MSTTHSTSAAVPAQPTTTSPASGRQAGSHSPQASPGDRTDQAAAVLLEQPRPALAGDPVGAVERGAILLAAADGGQGRPPKRSRRAAPSTSRSGRSLRQKVGAVLAALALVVSTVSPAGAHRAAVRVGGDCPNHSASIHHDGVNGTYTVQLSPVGWNHGRCLRSQILVRVYNINGYGDGWATKSHYGDPGILNTWIAQDVRWTKHNVRIRKNGQEYWAGLTLYH